MLKTRIIIACINRFPFHSVQYTREMHRSSYSSIKPFCCWLLFLEYFVFSNAKYHSIPFSSVFSANSQKYNAYIDIKLYARMLMLRFLAEERWEKFGCKFKLFLGKSGTHQPSDTNLNMRATERQWLVDEAHRWMALGRCAVWRNF